ncbi:MAG: tetratricopeptide repeat protein [Acidobacteria bacterium]|nr:tetratricopeptide repeat protein [Acidobacteriota bacterium]
MVGGRFDFDGDLVRGDKHVHEAPPPTISALHQMPPPPGDFTGRAVELAELLANIERGVQISGLQGQGGIGKTALALKLAERLAPRCPDAQFYLDLKGADEQQPLSASAALSHVLRAYYPTAKLPEGEAELRALYLSVLHGQRALLLMDNARDAAQVTPLIPPAGCVLLVTSRQHFHLPGLYAKDLDTLPPADARALLLKIAPRIDERADEIARLCGHLPLALRLAASALAERKDLSAADYARRLTDSRQRLKLIEAPLKLSYDLLSAELQGRWRALAVFPATFDAGAAAAVWETEPDAAQDALGELVKYSLLDWDDTTARYRLHDLARLFADSRLSDDERYAAQARHAGHYLGVLGEADALYEQGGEAIMRGLALFDAEWTNIQAGQSWGARHVGDNDITARLCSRYPDAGVYLLGLRQHPRERVNWLEQALAAARKANDRPAEGSILGNLGLAYAALGETRRAVELYEQVLLIAREIGDRRGEGYALNNLGLAYAALGETSRAVELFEQYRDIAREIGDRRGEGSTLGNLGIAYKNLGDPRRAVELHEQALAIDREIGDRRGEGQDLGNLGLAYAALGETSRAVELYEQQLLIVREMGDRSGEGNALGNLGIAYKNLGETSRAVELYEQALAIRREIGDRRGEGNDLFNMSLALDKLGDRRAAVAYAEAALKIYDEIEDPWADKVTEKLKEWRGEAG